MNISSTQSSTCAFTSVLLAFTLLLGSCSNVSALAKVFSPDDPDSDNPDPEVGLVKLNGIITSGGGVTPFASPLISGDSSRVVYCANQDTDDVLDL